MKKNILFLFAAVSCFLSVKAQHFTVAQVPEKGDFVCLNSNDSAKYHFIFRKSRNVYYDFDFATNKAGNKSKADEKRINDLFNAIDKVKFEKIASANEQKLYSTQEGDAYRFIEYKKDTRTHKIVWNTNGTDKSTIALNGLVDLLNGFW